MNAPLSGLLAHCEACKYASGRPSITCYACVKGRALTAPYPCPVCEGSRLEERYTRCRSCHEWGLKRSFRHNYAVAYASQEVHEAVKAYKYDRSRPAGLLLVRLLEGFFLNNDEEFSRFHYIVPAPWYPSDGGAQFDHVAKLLTEASKYMGWTPTPFGHSILKKTARTEHMAGKDLPARLLQQNEIYQALEVPSDAPAVRGCRVLVVDDLMTSGVTLNAAARRLREHGAEEVSGLCLLRSVNAILLD